MGGFLCSECGLVCSSPLADYGILRAPLCGSSCGDQLTCDEADAKAIAGQAPRRGVYDCSTGAGWNATLSRKFRHRMNAGARHLGPPTESAKMN